MPTDTPPVSAHQASLDRVRRRVAALGFFAVAIHGVIGAVVVAHIVDGQGRPGDAVGLLVMSAVMAVLTYTVVRLILQAPLFSPAWMLLAAVPTSLGFWWVL